MGLLGAALGAAVGTGDVLFMKGKITRTVTDTLGVSRQFMRHTRLLRMRAYLS